MQTQRGRGLPHKRLPLFCFTNEFLCCHMTHEPTHAPTRENSEQHVISKLRLFQDTESILLIFQTFPSLKSCFSNSRTFTRFSDLRSNHSIHINILIIYGVDPNFKTACTYPGADAGELVGVVIVPLFEHGSDGSGQQVHDGLTQVTHLDRQRGAQTHDDRVHTHGLGRGRTLVRRLNLTHYTQSEMQKEEFFFYQLLRGSNSQNKLQIKINCRCTTRVAIIFRVFISPDFPLT